MLKKSGEIWLKFEFWFDLFQADKQRLQMEREMQDKMSKARDEVKKFVFYFIKPFMFYLIHMLLLHIIF